MTDKITPTDVHPPFIQTVERDVITREVTRDFWGAWPEDERVQRAWAIDRAVALHPLAVDARRIIEIADAFLAYVEDGTIPDEGPS